MKHDIAELDLSVRAYNCLKRAGIHYVEDVSEMSDADLLAVRHLGVRCLHEVREKVAACEHGMSERDQFKAENATLRTQLADVTESIGRVEERCAKLRELLARVERARRDLCDAYPDAELLNCEECPAWSECKGDLADRMRELGVEVP